MPRRNCRWLLCCFAESENEPQTPISASGPKKRKGLKARKKKSLKTQTRIDEQMNDFAVSEHDSPVCAEELNIRKDSDVCDDSESENFKDKAVVEQIGISSSDPIGLDKMLPDSSYDSVNPNNIPLTNIPISDNSPSMANVHSYADLPPNPAPPTNVVAPHESRVREPSHHALHSQMVTHTRNSSGSHFSTGAHDPHYSSGDAIKRKENNPGRWRDDRFDRDYRGWSRDPRLHDYYTHQHHSRNPDRYGYSDYQYYGRYPEHYGYDRRRHNEGYDYYGEPGYYEQSIEQYDGYDRSIRHHRFPNYYDDYYSHGYGRGPYYDKNNRSVYSERSAVRHPANDTYNASNQDISHSRRFLDESSMVDSSYPLPSSDGAHQQQQQPKPQAPVIMTPAKFSCAHPIARFGPGGVLITIMPQPSADGNTSSVQIHSVETLLQKTKEAENFNRFPGPLSKSDTHKNDVIQFTKLQIRRSTADTSLIDRESTRLVWEFLDLMVRQNGSVLGPDIAELLMRNHSGDFGLLPSPKKTPEVEHTPEASSLTHPEVDLEYDNDGPETRLVSNSNVHASKRFRELLLYGRRKDALEWAMRSSLWGHALLLASKTDASTHGTVMLRFANSLPINDPLQTLYQMISGRQPASTTLIADEGWGSWRPHLAMILSNATENVSFDTKLLLTMGDTLCTRGLIDAAHFCYLVASTPLGYYTKKSSKLVLIGSSHFRNFKEFSNSESIERSEIYEYAIALSTSGRHRAMHVHIPALQIFKFIYACRLMDAGLITKAFHYFETIAKLVNSRPTAYSITFVRQLSALVDRLKPHNLRAQAGSLSESDLQWTHILNANLDRMQHHLIHPSSSCAQTSDPSDVTYSVGDARHPGDDDDYDDDDTISQLIDSEKEEDGEDDEDQYEPDPSSRSQVSFHDKNHMQHLGGPPLEVHPPPAAPPNAQHCPSSISQDNYQISSGFSSVPHFASSFSPMMQPTSAPPISQHLPDTVLPPPVGANLQQPYTALPSLPASQTLAGHSMNPIDHELSQASMPVLYNPIQLSIFQSQTQLSTNPNTSIPLFPPQLPPLSDQASPPGDIYEHIVNNSPEFESLVRSKSQTSYKSRRSRLSRKSTGRRSRSLSERSRASVASDKKEETPISSKGWSLFNWFKRDDKSKAHRVHLPDDSKKDIQWDSNLKRWVDANATEEEMAPPEPPPMDSALPPSTTPIDPTCGPAGNLTLTRNKYSLKSLSNRTMYKDVFCSSTRTTTSVMAPLVLPATVPGNILIPSQTPSFVPASMEQLETAPKYPHMMNPTQVAGSTQTSMMNPVSQVSHTTNGFAPLAAAPTPHLPIIQPSTHSSLQPSVTYTRIDHELSQASMPVLYNPIQLSTFQSQTQLSTNPNTSIPLSPPQLPPLSDQASPPGDIYEHIVNNSPEFESLVRSKSQTSYGSRRSRLSRKSTGRRSRSLSERSRASVASDKKEETPISSKGWSLFNWFKRDDKSKAHRVHLPDDSKKDIQWDSNLKRWVDANATEEEMAPPEPPPMDSALPPSTTPIDPTCGPAGNLTLTRNKYSLKSLSNRTMYKDVFCSSTRTTTSVMAPLVLPATVPGNILIPSQTPSFVPASMEQLETAPQYPRMMNPTQVAGSTQTSMMNPVSQVSHTTNGFAPLAAAPTPHLPIIQPSTHSSLQPSVTRTRTSSAIDQMAAPPMTTFYNPASFGSGVNAFSQSTRGAGRGKRGYPSVRQ